MYFDISGITYQKFPPIGGGEHVFFQGQTDQCPNFEKKNVFPKMIDY